MAAIDFPSNPTQGFEYSPPGLDTVYTFQNGVWTGVVTVADIYLPLTGGDLTGDVLFKDGATTKVLLSTTGNATFTGDVDIDGNLELGTIPDVEAAILAATPGASGNQISNGTSVLNFTATDGDLQSNVSMVPTTANTLDFGSDALPFRSIYVDTKIEMGGTTASPYILIDGINGKFKGIGDLEIGPYESPAVIVNNDGTITASGNITIGPIGGSPSITLNTSGEIIATSLAGTGVVNLGVDANGKLVRGAAVPSQLWIQNDTNLYPATATSDVLVGGTLPASPAIRLRASDGNIACGSLQFGGQFVLEQDGDIVMGGDLTGCDSVQSTTILTLQGAAIVLTNQQNGQYTFTNAGSPTSKGNLDFGATTSARSYAFPDKDGTVALTSDFTGTGVTFKGPIDVTTDVAPSAVAGDFYLNTVAGNALVSYTGLDEAEVALNQFIFYTSSSQWILGGLTGGVGAVVTVDANAPANPGTGDLWYDTNKVELYVYNGTAWVPATPISTVSATAPSLTTSNVGDLWWDEDDGNLYIVVLNAGNAKVWVPATATVATEFWTRTGTILTTSEVGDSIQLTGDTSGGINIQAAATTTPYTITLPPAVGANKTVLATDDQGVLSWSPVSELSGVDGMTVTPIEDLVEIYEDGTHQWISILASANFVIQGASKTFDQILLVGGGGGGGVYAGGGTGGGGSVGLMTNVTLPPGTYRMELADGGLGAQVQSASSGGSALPSYFCKDSIYEVEFLGGTGGPAQAQNPATIAAGVNGAGTVGWNGTSGDQAGGVGTKQADVPSSGSNPWGATSTITFYGGFDGGDGADNRYAGNDTDYVIGVGGGGGASEAGGDSQQDGTYPSSKAQGGDGVQIANMGPDGGTYYWAGGGGGVTQKQYAQSTILSPGGLGSAGPYIQDGVLNPATNTVQAFDTPNGGWKPCTSGAAGKNTGSAGGNDGTSGARGIIVLRRLL